MVEHRPIIVYLYKKEEDGYKGCIDSGEDKARDKAE